MRQLSLLLLSAAVLIPSSAEAQKRPSNNMHTRSADVYLDQARRASVNDDRIAAYEKALAAALEGTRNDPDNPRSWFQAAQAYAGMRDYRGADSTLAKAEAIYPDYASETEQIRQAGWIDAYNDGVRALQQGDLAAAAGAFELADRLYRKRPEALVSLGSIYAEQGNLPKAEQTYLRALEVLRGPHRTGLNQADAQAWAEDEVAVSMRLSNLYMEQERFADAEKIYRELAASQPSNLQVKAALAGVMTRQGRTADAAAIYRDLLASPDANELTLFNVGVGLFRAEEFGQAAEAFRRVIALNAHSHDALYNLSNAIFAHTAALEKEKESAPAERKSALDAELLKLYDEMRTTSEALLGIDPANRNVLMMLAQSQRSLGELSSGPAAAEWQAKVLATLERHKALPFEVQDLRVVPGTNEVQVNGRITNLTVAQGSPIRLDFIVVGPGGAELVTENISVTAPATEESARFNATVRVPENAVGWKYRIVR